jgi:hypothetical protein
MEQQQEQAKLESWAIVDVVGRQRYVGYVRTETYGQAVMFRVDVPELPEREFILENPEYIDGNWTPAGAKVKRDATPGHTKLIGAGSIYTISSCTEVAALKAQVELKLIALPQHHKALAAAAPDPHGRKALPNRVLLRARNRDHINASLLSAVQTAPFHPMERE